MAKLWANFGHFYAPHAFLCAAIWAATLTFFNRFKKIKYPNAQVTQTKPYSLHNHSLEQLQEIPILSAHIESGHGVTPAHVGV